MVLAEITGNPTNTETLTMSNTSTRSRGSENSAIVDRFVDQEYLQLIDVAWAKVSGYARDILSKSECNDPPGATTMHALDWLRTASSRENTVNSSTQPRDAELTSLEVARDSYPGFLKGETNGTNLLFSGDGLKIWQDYYKSSNPLYAPLNEIGAAALAHRVKEGVPFRILEIGAGTGGATTAAINALEHVATAPVNYLVTDISVRLLRSTAEHLNHSASTLIETEFERYDLNAEPVGKLVAAGDFDVVIAVNALHNAQDLPASLRILSSLLKEGGALIISESICGEGEQVHQEFFLNLLPQHQHRQGCSSRFLSSEEWRHAISNADLKGDIAINSTGPELMLLATVSKK